MTDGILGAGPGHGYRLARTAFATSFEPGEPVPVDAGDGTGPSGVGVGPVGRENGSGPVGAEGRGGPSGTAGSALRLCVAGGPGHVPAGRPGVGLTGVRALRVTGPVRARPTASADGIGPVSPPRRLLFDGLDVEIGPDTELRYAVCPVLDAALTYRATFVAVDCLLDDGTWTGDLDLSDQHGAAASARGQGAARILLPDHWNLVRVGLGDRPGLVGQRVVALAVVLDPPAVGLPDDARSTDARPDDASSDEQPSDDTPPPEAWFDDLALGTRAAPVRRGPVDHVDTRRGTHSTGTYSRGNTLPATAVPNGCTLWTPLTDAGSATWLYSWAAHNDAANRPRWQGIGISHQPSPWMGDRNQLAFHPVPEWRAQVGAGAADPGPADPGGGASSAGATHADVPDASLAARALAFDHDEEVARPHAYGVTLDGGTQAAVAPTDHGGVLRFAFPPGLATGHVLVDAVSTEGAGPDGPAGFRLDPESGTLTGWVDHGSGLSVGRSRMFVVGRFSRPPVRTGRPRGDRECARHATFTLGDDPVVELRVATSFIGVDQAWHTYDLELADRTFADVAAAARVAWEERLSVVEVEGATDEQLATLYGGLYRLNLYPTSQTENAGTADAPDPWHASPVAAPTGPATDERTGAAVLPGPMVVNHGFWDTYRTCWPAYALLYPGVAAALADGFVQQYREGGWTARWSSPGYADLMTGTSSDVAFADLHAKGVPLPDPLATYDAGLRNATVIPPCEGVGRKGQAFALLHGYVLRDVHESVSWHLEGCLNDAGLAGLARALAADPRTPARRRRALADEAAYLAQRAAGHAHLFDPAAGCYRGRGRDGGFDPAEGFDPAAWGGDYTESDAWNFAFHAPHDPAGLAALHGGPDGLAAALDRFFATPERADRPGGYGQVIHEMVEARDVRLGQLGQSNQVSHHIPYTWLAAGRPDRTQEVVRDILARLWTGSAIGQGYHGDEDNGEMSAWYVLSALGLYPLEVGTPRWAVGSPLFRRAVVHHPTGDLVIEAPGNGPGTPYVQGLAVDGRAVDVPWIAHDDLLGGATVTFAMGATASEWGRAGAAVGRDAGLAGPWRDITGPPLGDVATDRSLGAVRANDMDAGRGDRTDAGRGAGVDGAWRGRDGAVPGLSDDDLDTAVDLTGVLSPGGVLHWSGGPGLLMAYTVTSALDGRPAPAAWTVEVRPPDGPWSTVDERTDEVFPWPGQLRPFLLDTPTRLGEVRLTFHHDPGHVAQLELLVHPAPG